MNYSVFKIPVNAVTKKYYEKRFRDRMDLDGYMHMDKTIPFGLKITHYMDVWWQSWELPKVEGVCIKVKMPKVYMNRGINKAKLAELGKLLNAEAMEFLLIEIACAALYPGVSVTEAIITVMGHYDISDEDYRTDSMRRHFDRYSHEVTGLSFKDFSAKLNSSIKMIYERMVQKGKDLGEWV